VPSARFRIFVAHLAACASHSHKRLPPAFTGVLPAGGGFAPVA